MSFKTISSFISIHFYFLRRYGYWKREAEAEPTADAAAEAYRYYGYGLGYHGYYGGYRGYYGYPYRYIIFFESCLAGVTMGRCPYVPVFPNKK